MNCKSILKFPGIQEACCQYLIRNLDTHNCLTIWEFADKYSLDNLSQQCLAFAAQNIVDVSKSNDFYNLTATNITEVRLHFAFLFIVLIYYGFLIIFQIYILYRKKY